MKEKEPVNLILNDIKKGDHRSFELLYSEYYQRLCSFLLGYTSETEIIEDVVQDVFLKIWIKKEDIEITTSLNSYLYRTTYNTLMEKYRRFKKKNEMLSSYYYTALVESIEIDDEFKNNQLQILNDCIELLPQRSKEVFNANKIKGFKYQEVSDKLKISVKTVESHISRALKFLKNCIKTHNNIE